MKISSLGGKKWFRTLRRFAFEGNARIRQSENINNKKDIEYGKNRNTHVAYRYKSSPLR